MKLNIGDEIGYLDANTGRYRYAVVHFIGTKGYEMIGRIRTGQRTTAEDRFIERFENVERHCKAKDKFSKGKPYMKIKKATPGIPQNTIEINF